MNGPEQYRKSEKPSEQELLESMEQLQKITNINVNTSTGGRCRVNKISIKKIEFDVEDMQKALKKEEIQKVDSNGNNKTVF